MIWNKYDGSNFEFIDECGIVYAIEFGDNIKIGSTKNLNKRYKQLCSNANYYNDIKIGNCYYTIHHEKYRDTEQLLHKLFSNKRKPNTELFNMTTSYLLFMTKDINIDTEKIDHSKTIKFLDGVKEFIGIKDESINDNLTDDLFRKTYCSFCTNDEFAEIMELISMMNNHCNDKLYFTYLLCRMGKILYTSQERYLGLALGFE